MYTVSDLHEALFVGDCELHEGIGAHLGTSVIGGDEPQTEPTETRGVFEAELTEDVPGSMGETTRFRVTIERLDD
jgi:hypothetical protein